ncbi:zinc-binding dehydrogenase [Nocardiopsis trehalosi]|jgi:NADPH2:quinone reductase|uniref:zinc-binding dehydrogenase n=1 Tax=Nocardiopsis trehalosi TaxID=109329 RepID=UPI000835231D|nr:zinc-binding dehydrogenase [Nocardiopsis trehalosi]
MHAVRLHAFGPAENLVIEEVPDPVPGPGQVLIDVAAAGVHVVDTRLREGPVGGPFPDPVLPMVPGREVAGAVAAVGPGTDPAWTGRRVAVHLGPGSSGGYAERAVADAAALHALPDHVAADAAVAMVGTGRTAMAVLGLAGLGPGDTALVTAAAGGMGALFVQAARAAGAAVVGLAGGPEKTAVVRRLGADAAVDYRAADWTGEVAAALGGRAPTVLFDGVGGALGRAAFDLLGGGGRVLLHGYAPGSGPTAITTGDLVDRGLTATWAIGPHAIRRLGGLRELETRALAEAAAGRLAPLVTAFPLRCAADAHAALETRATTGKVVLVP